MPDHSTLAYTTHFFKHCTWVSLTLPDETSSNEYSALVIETHRENTLSTDCLPDSRVEKVFKIKLVEKMGTKVEMEDQICPL